MSLPRFLMQPLPESGLVALSKDEARHASGVLRLRPGDEICLFDGAGREGMGRITAVSKSAVIVELEWVACISRELANPIELVVALPKGDRQKTLIEMLVQLGVSKLTPLESRHGVAQFNTNARQRLERYVLEASKQCGRNQLMQVGRSTSVEELAAEANSAREAAELRCFAHPYGESVKWGDRLVQYFRSQGEQPASERRHGGLGQGFGGRVVIGPEGGFTEEECQQLREAVWEQVSLGERILRIETAAVMVAAAWASA